MAIQKLSQATELPRRLGRDEHPSHLYNTLGVAYARYANFLEEAGHQQRAREAWKQACVAFDRSISLAGGLNLDALLAFSERLVRHAEVAHTPGVEVPTSTLEEISQALVLLDEAEEILQNYPAPEADFIDDVVDTRARALDLLGAGAGVGYLKRLQESGKSDIGYYCEARLIRRDFPGESGLPRALEVFRRAEEKGVDLEARSLRLLLTLLREHPSERFDFVRLRELHRRLETMKEYQARPVELFRHAVLCYQTGEFSEGAERFRKLREYLRRSQIAPPRSRDIWRLKEQPTRPRLTKVKVTRVTNEWRAEGYIEDLRQHIPLRPRHFEPQPKENQIVACVIRFEMNGPLAVPPLFEGIRA